MKARLGWFIAIAGAGALAFSAAAQGTKLAVGPDAGGYLCPDGRQLYVKSCYDDLPDAKCGVVLMHLPAQNGFQRESTETRSKLTPSVAACKVYPPEFRNDGMVGLVVPKSAAPAQTAKAPAAAPAPSPATPTIPGPATRTALIRISGPGIAATVHYVDEASAKPTGQKDVVEIWALQVFPNGNPDFPNAHAVWTRNDVDCKKNTNRLTVWGAIDRQGKVLSAESTDIVQPVVKNSPNEKIAAAACKSTPLGGSRMLTVTAAIADADNAAAPTTAAKPSTPAAKPNAAVQARLDLLEEADRHFVDGDIELAIPLYERAMELDPKDVETAEQICTLSFLYVEAAEKGIIACERVLKLNPKNLALPHSAIARLQKKRGDNRKALVSALEWARLAPGESYAWTTLADIYVNLGRNTDALAAMQTAVKLQPKDWSILAKRGDVFRRLGKFTESIADYKAGIAIWPEGPELHHDLSDVLRAAGRKTEADAEQRLAIDYALSNGRNAIKKPADGSPLSIGSIIAAKGYLEMLEKWDKSAAAKLATEIKAAEQKASAPQAGRKHLDWTAPTDRSGPRLRVLPALL